MLNIWKKTWKEKDTLRDSDTTQDSVQEDAMGGTSFTSSVDVAETHPSSHPVLPLPQGHVSMKRAHEDVEPEQPPTAPSERPSKLSKFTHDTVRNRLPEILDMEQDESYGPVSMKTFRDQVLSQATDENTIVILPPLKSSTRLLIHFVTWAIEDAKAHVSTLGQRTVLVFVEDKVSATKYSSKFKTELPTASTTIYSEAMNVSLKGKRSAVHNDLVITSSSLALDSFAKGVLNMSQIHSLIISDVQYIKDHDSHQSIPIVQIMNDFYHSTEPVLRPRVFGLACPPPHRWTQFDSKMLKLESVLHSQVFGVSAAKRAEILALPDRPIEMVILYEPPQLVGTRLYKQLQYLDPTESIFPRQFKAARYVLAELGPCASDLVWRRALDKMDTRTLSKYDEKEEDCDEDEDELAVSVANQKFRIRSLVKDWPFTMPNWDISSRGFNVSPKFLKLLEVLRTYEPSAEDLRGIIFVQRRCVAIALIELLRAMNGSLRFLRPCVLAGHGEFSGADYQQEVFQKFASGTCNLLVATKAIEDLDVPKASTVIRFNLFESQVSHAYMHARTRGRESHLIHMAEAANDSHRRILSRNTRMDAEMSKWIEALCASPQSAIPPCTLKETVNSYHSDSEDENDGQEEDFIKDPTTSGRIYLQDATTVLYRFAASSGNVAPNNQILFSFEDMQQDIHQRLYTCRILLPGSPIDGVCGKPSTLLSETRRSAAFNACRKLVAAGHLDYRLFPIPAYMFAQHQYESRAISPDDEEPGNMERITGTNSYPRKKPDFWDNIIKAKTTSNTLYPTAMYIVAADNQLKPHAPMLILTRQPLPELPSFNLFFSGARVATNFERCEPFEVDDVRINQLHQYTLRICRAIMNKPFVCNLSEMLCFFAPLLVNWMPSKEPPFQYPSVVHQIPWNLISDGVENWAVPIKSLSPNDLANDLRDGIVQDRMVEFTRRYEFVTVRTDLTPSSKPDDSKREANYNSLVDFCSAMRKEFEGLENDDQPILEVERVPAVINYLKPTSDPLTPSSKFPAKYLIPELCAKFTVPASTMRTALLLPSVMRRIDDLLLVKEMNAKFFDHSMREDLLHVAICAPSLGVEYNYERLELLGDAFLKYLSSIYVFVTYPTHTEGALHVARRRIISNKSLLGNSLRVGLPTYIQSRASPVKNWLPPNFRVYTPPRDSKAKEADDDNGVEKDILDQTDSWSSVHKDEADDGTTAIQIVNIVPREQSGKGSAAEQPDFATGSTKRKRKSKRKRPSKEDDMNQWLGDKAIADVSEAIIGAAYISGGRDIALQVTKALTIPISNIDRWSDFGRKVLTPPPAITAKMKAGSIEAVETIIGHKFERQHLLAQAMTHSSIQGFETTSYERLEFIGDAVLDFLVIRYIFDRHQQLSPGGLTLLKAAMVSNSALAAVCVWSGLHDHLLFESYSLACGIHTYSEKIKAKEAEEYATAKKEGRSPGQYWTDVDAPKVLSDVIESILGALYISDNFSPVGAEAFFDNVLKPFYDKHITLKTLSHHPTKVLLELLQAEGCQVFEVSKEVGVDQIARCEVLVHDIVLACGEDATIAHAARRASLAALDALEGDSDFMTRTCDCRTQGKKGKHTKALEQAFSELVKD